MATYCGFHHRYRYLLDYSKPTCKPITYAICNIHIGTNKERYTIDRIKKCNIHNGTNKVR